MENEKQYVQGFNNGFLLAQYQMEIYNSIVNSITSKSAYTEGMRDGKEQLETGQKKEKMTNLQQLRDKGRSNERGMER